MEDKKINISAKQAFLALILFIGLGGLIYIGYYNKAHKDDDVITEKQPTKEEAEFDEILSEESKFDDKIEDEINEPKEEEKPTIPADEKSKPQPKQQTEVKVVYVEKEVAKAEPEPEVVEEPKEEAPQTRTRSRGSSSSVTGSTYAAASKRVDAVVHNTQKVSEGNSVAFRVMSDGSSKYQKNEVVYFKVSVIGNRLEFTNPNGAKIVDQAGVSGLGFNKTVGKKFNLSDGTKCFIEY